MRRPVSDGCDMLPTIDALKAQWKGDRLMKKNSTVAAERKQLLEDVQVTL